MSMDSLDNPLLRDSPPAWVELIEAVSPAALLVVIEARMSAALKARHSPEDILQEALLHAWRDRHSHEWHGQKVFRNWLLTIIDHRIRDLAVRESAQKRGGDRVETPFSSLRPPGGLAADSSDTAALPGMASTTPSRIAIYNETAAAMRAALRALPEEQREIVRLRLFEQLSVEEIAERLQLGPSAVRHRFRKGAELYEQQLRSKLASRSQSISERSAAMAYDVGRAEVVLFGGGLPDSATPIGGDTWNLPWSSVRARGRGGSRSIRSGGRFRYARRIG